MIPTCGGGTIGCGHEDLTVVVENCRCMVEMGDGAEFVQECLVGGGVFLEGDGGGGFGGGCGCHGADDVVRGGRR